MKKALISVSRMPTAPATPRPYPSDQPRSAGEGPSGGGEGCDLGELTPSHAWQHGQKVVLHGHAEPAAGFDHRKDRSHLRSGLRATYVQPVLQSQGDRAHGVLRQVVG